MAFPSLGKFPSSERYFITPNDFPRHLGKQTTVGVGSHFIYIGTGDSFEVAEFSLAGERVGTLREAREAIPAGARSRETPPAASSP